MKVNNTLQSPIFTKRCDVFHFLSSFRLLLKHEIDLLLQFSVRYSTGVTGSPGKTLSDVNISEVSIGGSQHLQYNV